MKVKMPSLRRPKYVLGAVLMAAAAVLPSLMPQPAFAAQLTERSIKMSTSAANVQNATYTITFDPQSATTIKSIVVDFCSTNPILGETCTGPADFSVGATPSASLTGMSGTWTADDLNSGRTLTLTNATGATAADDIVIVLSGVHNPSTVGTFYARLLTFANDTGANSAANYTDTTPGTPIDQGGIALSTAQTVSVAGTVQETLTFCVSGSSITTCSSTTAPELTLGNGDPAVLDDSAVHTGNVYSQITTNAGSGAVIRMKNSNSCGGLSKDNGTTCEIDAAGASPSAIGSGSALFGMKAASSGGTGTLTVASPYNTANYGMDDSSADNVTTTYGDDVASSGGVLSAVNTTYTFGARANGTTPAGLYTATMTLIATGTY